MGYLDGGHLGVSLPAEPFKLQGVEPEAHGPSVQHGALLYLHPHVMKVWEVVVHPGPGAHRQEGRQTGGQTDRRADRQEGRQTGGQTDRRADRQEGRQTGGQTDRRADRQDERQTG